MLERDEVTSASVQLHASSIKAYAREVTHSPYYIMQVLDEHPKYFGTNCMKDYPSSMDYLKPL